MDRRALVRHATGRPVANPVPVRWGRAPAPAAPTRDRGNPDPERVRDPGDGVRVGQGLAEPPDRPRVEPRGIPHGRRAGVPHDRAADAGGARAHVHQAGADPLDEARPGPPAFQAELPSFAPGEYRLLLWQGGSGCFRGFTDVVKQAVLAARARSRRQARSSGRVAQAWFRLVPVAWSMVSHAWSRTIQCTPSPTRMASTWRTASSSCAAGMPVQRSNNRVTCIAPQQLRLGRGQPGRLHRRLQQWHLVLDERRRQPRQRRLLFRWLHSHQCSGHHDPPCPTGR